MSKNSSAIRWIGFVGLAWVLTLACGPSVLAGGCFSAAIDAPIVLPGGTEVDSGVLTLCVTRDLSPVAALHKIYVDGNPVAMLLSRRGYSEGAEDGRAFMMFNRDSRGNLQLYGFATPVEGRMVTYHVANEPRPRGSLRNMAKNSNNGSARPAKAETLSTILVSAVGPSDGR